MWGELEGYLALNHAHLKEACFMGAAGYFVDSGAIANSHRLPALNSGCLKGHYGVGVGYRFGEHTFRLEDESDGAQYLANCNVSGCHSSAPLGDLFADTLLARIEASADSLQVLLEGAGILDTADADGVEFNSGISVPDYAAKILYNYSH